MGGRNGKKRNGKDGGWEASDVEIVCESVMSNACSKKVPCVKRNESRTKDGGWAAKKSVTKMSMKTVGGRLKVCCG